MCRIDAPFGNLTLDEKKDPTERFIQALDEFKAEGNFRKLMIKHFAENWQSVFVGISGLESSLDTGKHTDTDAERCISVLLSKKTRLEFSLDYYGEGLPDRKPYFRDFAIDVAKTLFPDSPYGFFSSGMNKIRSNYFLFVSSIYGEDYSFSKAVFDDEALNSLSETGRTEIIWKYFHSISPIFRKLEICSDKSVLLSELSSLASSNTVVESQSEILTEFSQGMEFIKLWIKSDAEAGRATYSFPEFIYSLYSPWDDIKCLLCEDKAVDEDVTESLKRLLDDYEREFEKLLYIYADLSGASCSEAELWACGIDSYVEHIPRDFDFSLEAVENLDLNRCKIHAEICSQLDFLQVEAWIKWSVKNDFQNIINSQSSSPELSKRTIKWVRAEYFESWKSIFLDTYNDLDIKGRLRVLTARAPYIKGQTEEFCSSYSLWCNELLSNLIKLDNFPKELTPDWSIISKDRLDRELYLPYIDKSIGILRGELSKAESTEEIEKYHRQLEKLLGVLDISSSRKALRHRLLLMRSSTEAFSDEAISKLGSPFERENFYKWYDSLKQLSDTHFAYQTNGNREVTQDNYKQVQNDFYVNFSHELAEFCLDRLRLRKGEKAIDGTYASNQVIEISSTWRQGYLKALLELGFDLNGKVHKTVNFTKKSDPDKDVRAIASECYKAVRRNAKKSPSIQDIKRSIVAAEWWLLICQRRELGLEVNHEEALKTRRNLMRNP